MNQQADNTTIKVGVIGAGGRMGRMLIEAIQNNPQTTLNAAIERQGSSLVGADAGEVAAVGQLDVQIVDDLNAVVNDIDVLIDFSLPDATEKNMQVCAEHNVAMVIGTTGFNEQQEQVLATASQKIAIVYAGNYSTGVNLSLKLLESLLLSYHQHIRLPVYILAFLLKRPFLLVCLSQDLGASS